MLYPRNIFKSPECASKNVGVLLLRFFQYRNPTYEHTYCMLIPNALAFFMFSPTFPIKDPLFLLIASSRVPFQSPKQTLTLTLA